VYSKVAVTHLALSHLTPLSFYNNRVWSKYIMYWDVVGRVDSAYPLLLSQRVAVT